MLIKLKNRWVSNYSELTHSVGVNNDDLAKQLKDKVSNYSELTHSVGDNCPYSMNEQFSRKVSNYSELTHSVGAYDIASISLVRTISFQLFRINPFGRAAISINEAQ